MKTSRIFHPPLALALLLLLTTLTGPTARADDGLFKNDETTVALWNLGELRGGVVRDKSHSRIDLQPTTFTAEIPPTVVDGKSDGKALKFPGKASLIETTGSALDTPKEVTVEAWIKLDPAGDGTLRGIFQDMDYQKCGYRLAVHETGVLVWMVEDGTKENTLLGATKLPLDEWIHVAGTYDGKSMKIYFKGAQDSEKLLEGGVTTCAGPLYVGRISAPGPPYFLGTIQALRLSNVARTKFDLP